MSVAKDIESVRKGSRVIGLGGVDVRKLADLEAAVEKCVKELGRLDFVIAGAAGNFLASIANISANAFKSVIDIDLIGSYNTVKATLPYLIESAAKHKTDGKTGELLSVPVLRKILTIVDSTCERNRRQNNLRLCNPPLRRHAYANARFRCQGRYRLSICQLVH